MSNESILSNLPTLEDILSRRTLPPVCLYNFYIVMRDKLHIDHLLDFYLDVTHHEILWRRYAKSILKNGDATNTTITSESNHHDEINLYDRLEHSVQALKKGGTPSLSSTIEGPISKYIDISKPVTSFSSHHYTPSISPSSVTAPDSHTMVNSYIDRHDLSASTESIVQTYLIPGAPKSLENILPASLRQRVIDSYLNMDGTVRHDPVLFTECKLASFLYMERWAYPTFIRLKVWGNVTERQQLYRLLIGLVSLSVAFSTAFSFIFLDIPQWGKRFWCLLPFWIGCYQCFVFLSRLDPILALLFNISETTTFHFNKISQPQVKYILRMRAIWLLIFSTLIAIIITIIFSAIPSTRL
ncbi:uncharacterized protein BX663DRAFT_544464 [Cokeromyces recurvatus]|uniref:uncharacterized protein n=1 Tax=Cokeromyces recurvatus TaxID=90255 RepID=UPI002220E08F|nr:uncharacterized protein BX663DRAFT_544464 [Cokeromyces recurvatus]KAI7900911.1 hypothetical protein BX663DRAFT_544464 [Cokeromyces recurvatus]